MTRTTCKHMVLDAAEKVVAEFGAAHLTLDAVAEMAGVSKGGLLYHFPTKEALIEAMMGRHMEKCDARRAAALENLSQDNACALKAEILSFLEKEGVDPRVSVGLFAAIANTPKLMELIRERNRHHFQFHDQEKGDFQRRSIPLLAAMGLGFMEMLNVSPFDAPQRKAIIGEILRMAEDTATRSTTE